MRDTETKIIELFNGSADDLDCVAKRGLKEKRFSLVKKHVILVNIDKPCTNTGLRNST